MNLFTLFFTLSVFYNFCESEEYPFILKMVGTDNDHGESVQVTRDGGFIVAGGTESFGAGSQDVLLSKFNGEGSNNWTVVFGGNDNDFGKSVQETSDGGFIVVGYTRSFGASFYNVLLSKFYSNGSNIWTSIFGGNNDDYGYSVQETSDGGFIVAGYTKSFGPGVVGCVLLSKFSHNGIHNWTVVFGGSNYDAGTSVQETQDGGFIVTGKTQSFGVGVNCVLLSKFNQNGSHNWTTVFGDGKEFGESVQETSGDGGFVVVGYGSSYNGFSVDVILSKFFSNGSHFWTTTVSGVPSWSDDKGYSVQETQDGGFIVAGETNMMDDYEEGYYDDVLLSKFNSDGSHNWTMVFGRYYEFDYGYSVQETSDGRFVVAGTSESGVNDVLVFALSFEEIPFCEECQMVLTSVDYDTGISIEYNPEGVVVEDVSSEVIANTTISTSKMFEFDYIYSLCTCFGYLSSDYLSCLQHGECIVPNGCECEENYFGDNCEINRCFGFLSNESSDDVCSGGGDCTGFDVCECKDTFHGEKCEIFECNGVLHYLSDFVCSGHGNCSSAEVCECEDENYFGDNCEINSCDGVLSNYSELVCSGGHGSCNSLDSCDCFDGYYSKTSTSFCNDWDCSIFHYNSEQACSSHGSCVSPDLCVCDDGDDYNLPYCTWECFDVFYESSQVCSGHGDCIEADFCVCSDNYGRKDCSFDNSLALGLGLGFGISIPLICFSICTCVLLCIVCTFFLCVIFCLGLLLCGVGLVGQIRTQKKRIKKFSQLKNFDLLLKEQEMEEKENYAKLEINKSLFTLEFDDIRTLMILGEGGSSSIVFKAEWAGKVVAFKCFKTRQLMSCQNRFDEFEREVGILSSLAHPNIIQFFGACLKPPRVGILMEFCSKGEILDFFLGFRKEYLYQYPIPEKIRLFCEVCSSLEYIHSRNVIHRDLKCENVLISENNSAKLMDFGLSRAVERMSVKKTSRIGTSVYMAPELVLSDEYDEKCDVFSLGIMIFVLLREDPHPYGKKNERQIEIKVANDPDFRPNLDELSLPQNYNNWMKELISNCFLHEPSERYSCKQIRLLILSEKGRLKDEDLKEEELKDEREHFSIEGNTVATDTVEKRERRPSSVSKEELKEEVSKLKKDNGMLRSEIEKLNLKLSSLSSSQSEKLKSENAVENEKLRKEIEDLKSVILKLENIESDENDVASDESDESDKSDESDESDED